MIDIINKLKINGFVNAGKIGLSHEEIDELSNLANSTFKNFSNNKMKQEFACDYIPPKDGSEIVARFPQQNLRAFELIEKILNNKKIHTVLQNVLGKNYRLTQIGLRRSLSTDEGLYLHQDAEGETNLGIMLSDNVEGNGSTIFLPSSHLIKTRMKVWNIETPPSVMKFFSFIMKKIKGKKGDCFFFFNRTWHGRSSNYSDNFKDVILMSFFPETANSFKKDKWNKDFLNSIKGSKFDKLININKEKSYKNESSKNSFALIIEQGEIKNSFLNKLKLFIVIFVLRSLFKMYRTFKTIFKFK